MSFGLYMDTSTKICIEFECPLFKQEITQNTNKQRKKLSLKIFILIRSLIACYIECGYLHGKGRTKHGTNEGRKIGDACR